LGVQGKPTTVQTRVPTAAPLLTLFSKS
jgi:hypothetical protein